jgi:hypothetical protein
VLIELTLIWFFVGIADYHYYWLMDDLRPLPPKIRMLMQVIAVALMVVPLGWNCGVGDDSDNRYDECV